MKIDSEQVAEDFVKQLQKLDRGEFAILKRNAGSTIENSHGAMAIFYSMMSELKMGDYKDSVFFLIATLYAINPSVSKDKNFGSTVKRMQKNYSKDSLNNRFIALLDESVINDIEAISHHLRQFVLMTKSKGYGINWCQLIIDLYWWDLESRRVQKEWAKTYFGQVQKNENEEEK